jgi:1,4-dihydroxy-6-naphthoate synthase
VSQRIHLGISTCPNDTFAFHGLLKGKVDTGGLDFSIELTDVQDLNERLSQGHFDVAKGSFHAALLLSDDLGVLPSGSALGHGVGPVVLATRSYDLPDEPRDDQPDPSNNPTVLCPGRFTTATLLWKLFHGRLAEPKQALFSEIMPALKAGETDLGVCIHEGRFTYKEWGLTLVEDLGASWETRTGMPLPLGGILARRTLEDDVIRRIQACVRASIDYAFAHREETLPTLRRYAQEMDDDVIWAHVDLYVNDWTRDLGPDGRRALSFLSAMARSRGLVPESQTPLEVLA